MLVFIYKLYFIDGIVSFQLIVIMNNWFLNLFSLTTFVAMLNLLSLLRYNETIAKLQAALRVSYLMIFSFTFVFVIIFLAFVSLATVYFGILLMDYSSFEAAAVTLLQGCMGKFNMIDVTKAKGPMGAFILTTYLMTIMVITLNFLVVIINDSLAETSDMDFTTYTEVIEYFWSSIFSFFPSSSNTANNETSEAKSLSISGTSRLLNDCAGKKLHICL